MPYVTQEERKHLDDGGEPGTPGGLTYLMTMTMLSPRVEPDEIEAGMQEAIAHYQHMVAPDGLRFMHFCVILGALDSCQREYIRRFKPGVQPDMDGGKWYRVDQLHRFRARFYENVVAPYEDQAIEANGDLEGFSA